VAEAVALRERYGVHPRAFSAFGYYEALGCADGEIDEATAIERDVARTRAYARRQTTWFRAEPDIAWLDEDDLFEAALVAARRVLAG
jgi:tRNA dimethylallyltransferase